MPGAISNEVARMMQGPQGGLRQPAPVERPGIGAVGGKAGLGPLLSLLAGGLSAGGVEHGKYGGGEPQTDRIIRALIQAGILPDPMQQPGMKRQQIPLPPDKPQPERGPIGEAIKINPQVPKQNIELQGTPRPRINPKGTEKQTINPSLDPALQKILIEVINSGGIPEAYRR